MRVETTLLGRPVEVRYRIGNLGCGVNGIALNGEALSFTCDANPHRRGAGLVAMDGVMARLASERNVLDIDIG
jgi:hypothetical protein